MTIIISAFPCLGKTTLTNQNKDIFHFHCRANFVIRTQSLHGNYTISKTFVG